MNALPKKQNTTAEQNTCGQKNTRRSRNYTAAQSSSAMADSTAHKKRSAAFIQKYRDRVLHVYQRRAGCATCHVKRDHIIILLLCMCMEGFLSTTHADLRVRARLGLCARVACARGMRNNDAKWQTMLTIPIQAHRSTDRPTDSDSDCMPPAKSRLFRRKAPHAQTHYISISPSRSSELQV